ncbi:MAG: Flp pilus assembly complex ATPase component TadA [Oscillospiraceae bacterium]|nr:Flp pilus assembly complex ATPase component TadA [Oscillospiraceae bacterium]
MQNRSSFRSALPYFPSPLRQALLHIPEQEASQITEIRLRLCRPLRIVKQSTEYSLTASGSCTTDDTLGITVTREWMDALYQNLCTHSHHAVQHMLKQGYVTTAGGNRAGIIGTAVVQGQAVETVRAISGINLRIASERKGCAEKLLQHPLLRGINGGILIAGPPASGKTTVLRDIARILGNSAHVCIIDERGELAAVQNGIPQFSVGSQTDVLDGYPKAEGISIAVRVMSPSVLICDEIGGSTETQAILMSVNTGVRLIASAHAAGLRQIYQRPQIRMLIDAGVFDAAFLLGTGTQCGQIQAAERLQGGTR